MQTISYYVFTILTQSLVLIVKPKKFTVERPYKSVCGESVQIRIDAECLTKSRNYRIESRQNAQP